jgi:hypothetical protein
MNNFSEILKDQAIFNVELESKLSKLSDVAPIATNPERVFNVRTRGGKQTTDPPYPKGTARPLLEHPQHLQHLQYLWHQLKLQRRIMT